MEDAVDRKLCWLVCLQTNVSNKRPVCWDFKLEYNNQIIGKDKSYLKEKKFGVVKRKNLVVERIHPVHFIRGFSKYLGKLR